MDQRSRTCFQACRAAACGLLLVVLAACGGSGAPPAAQRPRHLLLVSLDTVRADRLGAYGYAAAETPQLDRLARTGLRFDQATSPVPLTLPAHASLLTGQLPLAHGVRHNGGQPLAAGVETLATRLTACGFDAAAFVAAFVLDQRFGLGRGFQHYDDDITRDPRRDLRLEAERPAAEVVDRALAWLARPEVAASTRPRFLWVHLYDAHAPYTPPSPHAERHPGRPYDGEIAYVDAQLGRLLAGLEQRGLGAQLLVAVIADHGESLGEHGESTHGLLLYEPALRVPLLLAGPGLPAGRTVTTPVGLIDLAPTLAGLLGCAGDQPLGQGRDLSAYLHAGDEPPAVDLYAETQYPSLFGWSPLAALRRGPMKYVAGPRPELYDLARDGAEQHDLVRREPAVARQLASRLAELQAAAPDTEAASPAPDAETRARLASLGYAAGPAVAVAPGVGPEPRRMVGLFAEFEAAQASLDAGQPERAREQLERLVATDPANPVFRDRLASLRRQRGDVAGALELYGRTVEQRPEDPQAWYNLAITLQEAGRPAEALAALRESLRHGPDRPEARNALGIAYSATGEFESARAEFAAAIELDDRDPRSHNNLGNALRGLRRDQEAEAAYLRALELAPEYAEALNGLGALEVERDRPRQALEYFQRALAAAPEHHETRFNLAIAHEMAGDRQAAIEGYRAFLAATASDGSYASQRHIARGLLDRLLAVAGRG